MTGSLAFRLKVVRLESARLLVVLLEGAHPVHPAKHTDVSDVHLPAGTVEGVEDHVEGAALDDLGQGGETLRSHIVLAASVVQDAVGELLPLGVDADIEDLKTSTCVDDEVLLGHESVLVNGARIALLSYLVFSGFSVSSKLREGPYTCSLGVRLQALQWTSD